MTTQNYIRHQEGHIEFLIYPNGNGYPIEHCRMDTPKKVLGWLYHLTRKWGLRTHL